MRRASCLRMYSSTLSCLSLKESIIACNGVISSVRRPLVDLASAIACLMQPASSFDGGRLVPRRWGAGEGEEVVGSLKICSSGKEVHSMHRVAWL